MASSVYKAQHALEVCSEHSSNKLTLFCKFCKKKTCNECVKREHIDHDWDVISSVATERRTCLPNICGSIRSNKLHTLKTLITAKASDDDSDEFLQQLEKKRLSIIEVTNKLINENKERYKTLKRRGSLSQSEIKEMLDYMDRITESLGEKVHTYSDHDVLDMEQDMMSTLKKLESHKREIERVPAIFLPGQLDHKVLNNIIGEVVSTDQKSQSTVDVTEMKTFKDMMTYRIRSVQNGQAWIQDFVDSKVKLFGINSKEVQTLNYIGNDFVVMDNGDHVFTDREGRAIRVITPDGIERKMCSTNSLIPTLVSKTREGDLLISMRNEADVYTITPSSRRLIQRMNMKGDVVTSYEFYEDGKTRLFTVAYTTAENGNGDVCAINDRGISSGELIILHRDGRVRAAYEGRGGSTKPFDPLHIACDSRCRIIVSDFNNNSVHLLSYDGTFLKYLLSGLSGGPICVSLYDDNMWMSFMSHSSKEVKVYKYK